jgi:DNA-binding CsgD family transcriptional regulator
VARVIKDQSDRAVWHRMASTIGPDDALAAELDEAASRSQRRGALVTAIFAEENAARLSSTALARSERLLRAAGFAADMGQPETVERLLREATPNESHPHLRARFAWIREISEPLTVIDLARISPLVGFAADARTGGDDDLALELLWRAAQRCWWGHASDAVRASVHAAARQMRVPATDARLIAIAAYVEPLKNGGEIHRQLAAQAAPGVADPGIAWTLGLAANTIGAFDFGLSWLTAVSTAFREQGRLGDLARVLFARGWAEMETGDWMGATRSAGESLRFAEEVGATGGSPQPRSCKRSWLPCGEISTPARPMLQVERLVLSPNTNFLLALLQTARGIAALGAGRSLEAYEHLQRLHAPADPAFNTNIQFFSLADSIEAAVSCGQEAVAAAAIDDVERRSAPMAVPWVQIMLSYSKALLAPPARAETFFQDGLGTISQNWPFLRGRLLLAYGEWLRRQRRVMDARAPLRTARDILDALGAVPWGNRARRELRAAGEVSRPQAGRLLDALTPQELQIAELAADGFSNKEIGARLYLSHRTVGYHLYRIFPKLGITARSGLRTALNCPQPIA